MGELETKALRIDLRTRRGKRQLEKLLQDGWSVASQSTRGALAWSPGQTDVVLARTNAKAVAKARAKEQGQAERSAQDVEQRNLARQKRDEERDRLSATPSGAHVQKAMSRLTFREAMAAAKLSGPSKTLLKTLEKGHAPSVSIVTDARRQMAAFEDPRAREVVSKLLTHLDEIDPAYRDDAANRCSPNSEAPLSSEIAAADPSDHDSVGIGWETAVQDLPLQLKQLADLHRAGDLSDGEFQTAKDRILDN